MWLSLKIVKSTDDLKLRLGTWLFERAYQHSCFEGTGVGLAIVRKAMEKMGGAVGIESDGVNELRCGLNYPTLSNDIKRMILLVEDNEDDVFIMKRTLSKSSVKQPLQVATHGREAVEYLQGTGKFADRATYPLPAVIFLDLKMPMMDGFDVLRWRNDRPELLDIPVAVLTSSPEERDRKLAKELGAGMFLVKPPTPEMVEAALFELLPHR